MRIEFLALGVPATAGSKSAFPFKRKDGSLGVAVSDSNPKGKAWKSVVADSFRAVWEGPPLRGTLALTVRFYMPRIKGHYRTGKRANELREDAPEFHSTRPDATKLLRCLEDGLNGIAWLDDAQIVRQTVEKLYGDTPMAQVKIEQV